MHRAALLAEARARRHMARLLGQPRRKKYPARIVRQQHGNDDLRYLAALQPLLQLMHKLVQQKVLPRLTDWVRRAGVVKDAAARADQDYGEEITDELDALETQLFEQFPAEKLEVLARSIAQSVSARQREQLALQVKQVLGIDLLRFEPKLQQAIGAFTAENVALIKSVPERYFHELATGLLRGIRSGQRAEELAGDIEARFGVAESRAALIARDQVGRFFSDLNRERQVDVGVDSYTWRTSLDERVRPEHAALEGKSFQWDSPPAEGHPGFAIQCRCTAEPNLQAIFDDL